MLEFCVPFPINDFHICAYICVHVYMTRRERLRLQYIHLGFLGNISIYTFMATFEKSTF